MRFFPDLCFTDTGLSFFILLISYHSHYFKSNFQLEIQGWYQHQILEFWNPRRNEKIIALQRSL